MRLTAASTLIGSLSTILLLAIQSPLVAAQSSVATTGACAYFAPGTLLRGTNTGVTVVTAANAVDTAVGNICICEQAGAINSNSVATVNSKIVVGGTVGATLTTLENLLGLTPTTAVTAIDANALLSLQTATQCSYPANSNPACGTSCAFTCQTGYTLCSGLCRSGSTCPSGTTRRRSLPDPAQRCPGGQSACKIPASGGTTSGYSKGSTLTRGYECVDVEEDIEQCGGCIFPLAGDVRIGVDCTALTPFADSVSCRKGACYIESCAPGYLLEGEDCIKIPRKAFWAQQGSQE